MLKGRPRLYIHVQWTPFVYLKRFRRYSTFYADGISLLEWYFGIWTQTDPKNVKWEKNTCWEGTALRQTASFEPMCVTLSPSVWRKSGRNAGKQKGRKVTRSVYFMYAWSDPWWADSNQTWQMCSSDGHNQTRKVSSEFSELWVVEVSMLPYGTQAVLNTLLGAQAFVFWLTTFNLCSILFLNHAFYAVNCYSIKPRPLDFVWMYV